MAYDEQLAARVHAYFQKRTEVEVKKMFGGLCFMVSRHMCCGIVGDALMARVGPENYPACLRKPHTKPMDFTGKPMKGMVYVTPEGCQRDNDLEAWLTLCETFVASLPPKP